MTAQSGHLGSGRTGVAVIGLGGAVATTAVAGVEQMRLGSSTTAGLPFAHRDDLIPYESLVFGGWDLQGDDLAKDAGTDGATPGQLSQRVNATVFHGSRLVWMTCSKTSCRQNYRG